MKRFFYLFSATLFAVCLFAHPVGSESGWNENININKADLSSQGSNPYFILEPGYKMTYKSDEGSLVITVLNETKLVDGVQTRIVEERESAKGKLVEVSRNYFAISKKDHTVYYFGEDVDMIGKDGKVKNHEGTWLAGTKGAKAGIMMPGKVYKGLRHYQELAPKVAMDRAEVVSVKETMETPAGKFNDVLKTVETSPVETGAKEYKFYGKGVGLLKDEDLLLVSYGK